MMRFTGLMPIWKAPQAELVRRAILSAQAISPLSPPSVAIHNFLLSGGGLNAAAAGQYLEDVREKWKE